MIKNRILLVLLFSVSIYYTDVLAVYSSKDFVKGDITLANGKVINCYIEYHFPGVMQNGVTYLDETEYQLLKNGKKVKKKLFNKLSPKKIKEIKLSNGRKFKTVKFSDLTAVGLGTIPKLYILEIVVDGNISVFKKYSKTGGVSIVSGDEAAAIVQDIEGKKQKLSLEEKIAASNQSFEILIHKKGDKMAKSISSIVIDKFIKDKKDVFDKYKSGQYGSINTVLSQTLKPTSFNNRHPEYADDFIRMIEDYNK